MPRGIYPRKKRKQNEPSDKAKAFAGNGNGTGADHPPPVRRRRRAPEEVVSPALSLDISSAGRLDRAMEAFQMAASELHDAIRGAQEDLRSLDQLRALAKAL